MGPFMPRFAVQDDKGPRSSQRLWTIPAMGFANSIRQPLSNDRLILVYQCCAGICAKSPRATSFLPINSIHSGNVTSFTEFGFE